MSIRPFLLLVAARSSPSPLGMLPLGLVDGKKVAAESCCQDAVSIETCSSIWGRQGSPNKEKKRERDLFIGGKYSHTAQQPEQIPFYHRFLPIYFIAVSARYRTGKGKTQRIKTLFHMLQHEWLMVTDSRQYKMQWLWIACMLFSTVCWVPAPINLLLEKSDHLIGSEFQIPPNY